MLSDGYHRQIQYLRVSLTDKCNLRCVYCMPPEGVELLPHDEVLRNEELVYFISLFVALGVKKVRFTGGEPLVRKGWLDIIQRVRQQHPQLEIGLSTNGVLLADYLESLSALRVEKINISLDTLNRQKYIQITGRDVMSNVLLSIDKAVQIGTFNVKLNVVLFEETLDEIDDLLNFAAERKVVIRFIERMPFLAEGKTHRFLPIDVLMDKLQQMGYLYRDIHSDTNVAQMYELAMRNGKTIKIGIIPAMTAKFCNRCNKIRLTCDGHLKTCLYETTEYDLKTLYRQDMGDDVIKKTIFDAVNEKPLEHRINCTDYARRGCASILSIRTMSKIGG